jgi:hypothetical protein
MLIYLDGLTGGKEEEFKVKLSLASSGHYEPSVLFPDWFGIDQVAPTDDEPFDDSDTDFDYSGVKWELPSDGDKEALAQLSQVMSANRAVAVNGDGGGQNGEALLFANLAPDDGREWV